MMGEKKSKLEGKNKKKKKMRNKRQREEESDTLERHYGRKKYQ